MLYQSERCKRWSKAEQEELHQIYGHMSACEVATILGRTAGAVYCVASEMGITVSRSRSIAPSHYLQMVTEEAAKHNISVKLILSKWGPRKVVRVRWLIWKRFEAGGYSLLSIARAALRDPTTVLYGLRCLEKELKR